MSYALRCAIDPLVSFGFAVLLACAACAHRSGSDFVQQQYTKFEYRIPMRDGVKLFTSVYIPKDASDANRYPILLKRTPFAVAPYGADAYPKLLGPNAYVMRDKYIFAYQEIRGRGKSDGTFVVLRPYVADSISEATDAYDTITWLLAHIPHHNGRVGAWGTSYAGFLASMSALSHHPALVMASPQAPATDSYFEDFHHNGALTQGYFYAYPYFDTSRAEPKIVTDGMENDYAFQLAMGPLEQTTEKYYQHNSFWRDILAHPNYDAYWQSRAVPPVLTGIHAAMLVAGGWYDAENLYGTFATYKALVRQDSAAKTTLVMGPFRHNGWEVPDGDSLATKVQRDVEAPYFRAYMKGDGKIDLPAALMFDTGRRQWRSFSSWPAREATTQRFYFHADRSLSPTASTEARAALSYLSDPAHPVPSRCAGPTIEDGTLNHYMSDDQRCYESRTDVLTFQTAPLASDVTLGGEIWARLNVSTTGTDADYIVKVIDVYPPSDSQPGYAPLVRGEIMRARFRQSFAAPQPMRPEKITPVAFRLQDVLHTFRAGHRLMVQVQSTWFPAFDRNPQKYVPNIYQAGASDFVSATERLWVDRAEPSYLEVQVIPHD
jgi:uncharacterized protein